ncbi:AfsR/SARP family transcriptional regulator [Actinoalloteichus hymeniacidonis]|uniref:DNA-binding transcriptional activator of the SARP family n=1 Tax=Actinoalloteichus hymeniacidonis TaxID=340345 RepID=A0AAC9HUY3_9PSEU|nr:AfsR/SARP family transcriptional regulator [Actinoalloteichus hymeniacidonis]AOS65606.1 DNA-binding transcriptional activator of the SARP family [Actinoalloteichus hymeniacidonis]MBB5906304.1 DNA-binding SARP family transcriptional activator [Actinoalloteichus hymeniacidonis]
MIRFSVLNRLETRTELGSWIPNGPKLRKVFAVLLLRANQVVEVETLADELWESKPPRNGKGTIRTHVYHLRRMLEAERATQGIAPLLMTEPAGYLIRVRPEELDSSVFVEMVSRGRSLLEAGAASDAAETLREALAMLPDRPLSNVSLGPVLSRHVTYLEEVRNRALELRIEADLRLGRHRELVAELRSLIAAHPLNEWFHARLIESLHRSGRRGEALMAYHDLRGLLDEELGLEPSEEVRLLQAEILATPTRFAPQPRHRVPAVVRAVS